MSLVRTRGKTAFEATVVQNSLSSRIVTSTLRSLIAPVRADFDAVSAKLDEVLRADVPTADAVSRYVARTKGKGIRPALVLLSAKATGGVTPEARLAAAGIELLQASTLLHDDVIDDSALRRGMPSVNAQWGNEIAVLMGDVLFTQALELFVDTGSLAVMKAAARQTKLMVEGEVFARDLRRSPNFEEATYFDMIQRKTGALMALATEIGPILSGASDEIVETMRGYGELLGIAFQIADDILDVVGSPLTVGKPTGQDLREGTVTLPLIRALGNASNGITGDIKDMVGRGVASDDDWETVRSFIDSHEGVASASDAASDVATRARECLRMVPDSDARRSLERMLDYVVRRSI